MIERLKGLASLQQVHPQHDFDRGILEQGEQEVIGAIAAITSATSLLTGLQTDGPDVKHLWRNGFVVMMTPCCICVYGLAGNAQSVSDLLPRPALFPGRRDVVRLDPLSQAMERQRGAKPNCRVIRREIHAESLDVHACQFRLTWLSCQPKLTQQIATRSASDGQSRTHFTKPGRQTACSPLAVRVVWLFDAVYA